MWASLSVRVKLLKCHLLSSLHLVFQTTFPHFRISSTFSWKNNNVNIVSYWRSGTQLLVQQQQLLFCFMIYMYVYRIYHLYFNILFIKLILLQQYDGSVSLWEMACHQPNVSLMVLLFVHLKTFFFLHATASQLLNTQIPAMHWKEESFSYQYHLMDFSQFPGLILPMDPGSKSPVLPIKK